MSDQEGDVALILAEVARALGAKDGWTAWPGGWPEDIEAALADAVFSARAVYKSAHGRGVFVLVETWRVGRARSTLSLEALIAEIDGLGPTAWGRSFGSSQLSPSRPPNAPGGASKAAAVRQAAAALVGVGISTSRDITDHNVDAVKAALRSVPGIGYATTNYFLMLLGRPGVKPDRMIHRFVLRAIGREVSDSVAEAVITEAAAQLGAEPHELEHAIWLCESTAARTRQRRM